MGSRKTENQLRKELLVAESEMNRAQFIHEYQSVKLGVEKFARQALTLGAVATSVTAIAVGVRAMRKHPPKYEFTPRTSLIGKILSGIRFASKLWSGVQAVRQNGKSS